MAVVGGESVRPVARELLTRRYARVVALMLLVAAVCVLAGTWQIARYDDKHLANDDLRTNARDAATPVAVVLPVVGDGRTADPDAVDLRPVRATGSYDTAGQVLLRQQQVDGVNGYTVVTPLRTDTGTTLLVARGFAPSEVATLRPADVSPPPSGTVTVTGRAQVPDATADRFDALGNGQVESVDADAASARLGTPVFDGYVELEADQPGTGGLTALPAPDLSNPAGGAFEWQHLAYVVQWYVFAGLALAAPFVVVRVDRRRAEDDAASVVAHLALSAPAGPAGAALTAGGDPEGGDLVRQTGDADQRARDVAAYEQHVQETTARLADRYGRSPR